MAKLHLGTRWTSETLTGTWPPNASLRAYEQPWGVLSPELAGCRAPPSERGMEPALVNRAGQGRLSGYSGRQERMAARFWTG